jgi:hypothetical protein
MWVRERTASSSLEVGACDGLIRLVQGGFCWVSRSTTEQSDQAPSKPMARESRTLQRLTKRRISGP